MKKAAVIVIVLLVVPTAGAAVDVPRLEAFLRDPSALRPGTTMPHVLAGLEPSELDTAARELAGFLWAEANATNT